MAAFVAGVWVDMPPDLVNLGDNLELDRCAYEVRRSGQPLKLSRIPMELLLLLVERHGQLVTRDEIVERVWGKDVFLDADNSISATSARGRSPRTPIRADSHWQGIPVHRTGRGDQSTRGGSGRIERSSGTRCVCARDAGP